MTREAAGPSAADASPIAVGYSVDNPKPMSAAVIATPLRVRVYSSATTLTTASDALTRP